MSPCQEAAARGKPGPRGPAAAVRVARLPVAPHGPFRLLSRFSTKRFGFALSLGLYFLARADTCDIFNNCAFLLVIRLPPTEFPGPAEHPVGGTVEVRPPRPARVGGRPAGPGARTAGLRNQETECPLFEASVTWTSRQRNQRPPLRGLGSRRPPSVDIAGQRPGGETGRANTRASWTGGHALGARSRLAEVAVPPALCSRHAPSPRRPGPRGPRACELGPQPLRRLCHKPAGREVHPRPRQQPRGQRGAPSSEPAAQPTRLTLPKLPFPMARRIWKWSKFTAERTEGAG